MNLTHVPHFWEDFEYPLAWLERLDNLMQSCGGMTGHEQQVLRTLAGHILFAAAGEPIELIEELNGAGPTVAGTEAAHGDSPAAEGARADQPPRSGPPVPTTPRPPRPKRPTAPRIALSTSSRHGQEVGERHWSLNQRLTELGYPEDVDRSKRVRLGQAAVDAYKQAHNGRAPNMSANHTDQHARRVSLYREADLPLIDAVIKEILGEPPEILTIPGLAGVAS